MAKHTQRDNAVLNLAVAAVAILILGFVLVGLYLKHAEKISPAGAYARLGPMVVHVQDHGITATVYVRTSSADAGWLTEHEDAITVILQNALATADPARLRAPGGLEHLQQSLKDASNAALNTTKVQEILLADFVLSPE